MSESPTPEHGIDPQPAVAAGAADDPSWSSDVRAMWESADYPSVAEQLRPAALEVAQAAGAGAGRRALDLATGTGTVALGLTEAGWTVTAIDLAPALMAVGRRHADSQGLAIDWKEASLLELPVADSSVDLVTSGFGLIFAPDPKEALNEINRVLRPGGSLIFSAWTPTGTMGQMTSLIGHFLHRHEMAMAPFRWGEPALADAWLQQYFTHVQHRKHILNWPFDSPKTAVRWLFDHSPGHHSALKAAGNNGPALVASIETWMTDIAGGPHPFDLAPTCVITTSRRP